MKDKCEGHISLPREIAVQRMAEACRFERREEIIPIEDAIERILAQDIYSLQTLPNQLSSQWDGIAVRSKDFINGMPDTSSWRAGKEYVFCNTGIGIAGDYDTSIRIEEVDIDASGKLTILNLPEAGQFTIAVGSRVREGDLLVRANSRLTPILLSAIAMGGHTHIPVIKKPVVAFIPSGNELVAPGESLTPGKNIDSNSIMIRSKLLLWGAEPLMYPVMPDDPDKLKASMQDAIEKTDIIIINAGSSKGTDDFTVEVLESLGSIIAHEVDHGPGKHTSHTVAKNKKPIIGLSGPPGGAESTADFYVKPLVDRFLRQPEGNPPRVVATLTDDAAPGKAVEVIIRAILENRKDGYFVTPMSMMYNTNFVNMDKANCYLRIPPNSSFKNGDRVEVELRYPYLFI